MLIRPVAGAPPPISSGMFLAGFTQISRSSLATVGEAVAPICTPACGDANDANIERHHSSNSNGWSQKEYGLVEARHFELRTWLTPGNMTLSYQG